MTQDSTTYVALLRGINVGGNRKVPMAELREVALGLGWGDVATYINSGNLIFTSADPADTLCAELERGIEGHFGFAVPVIIRTGAELRTILDENPYPEGNPSQVTVAFCAAECPPEAEPRITALATEQERFTIAGAQVYVDFAGGLGRSKLAAKFDQAVGIPVTTRNVRTVAKLVDLL